MRHISFAWTTPALLAGAKTCTRRYWDDGYGDRFSDGELVAAYNRSPRAHGVKVATIRLTEKPRLESMACMPDTDYEAEGYAWMAGHPGSVPRVVDGAPFDRDNLGWPAFRAWQARSEPMWVVRFDVVEIDRRGFLALPVGHRRLVLEAMTERIAPLYDGIERAVLACEEPSRG